MADLMPVGVLADVLKVFTLPDNSRTAIVRARDKVKVTADAEAIHIPGALTVAIDVVTERMPRRDDDESKCVAAEIRSSALETLHRVSGPGNELSFNIENCDNSIDLINIIATNAPISSDDKIKLLRYNRIKDRAFRPSWPI